MSLEFGLEFEIRETAHTLYYLKVKLRIHFTYTIYTVTRTENGLTAIYRFFSFSPRLFKMLKNNLLHTLRLIKSFLAIVCNNKNLTIV